MCHVPGMEIRYIVVFKDGNMSFFDVAERECRGSDQVAQLLIARRLRAHVRSTNEIRSIKRALPGDEGPSSRR